VQLYDLFLMELSNWRWSWRPMLVTGTIAPLLSTLALGVFARDAGPRALAYVLTGNLVLSLMFGNLDRLQSRFCFMRLAGTLDYFATLPIQRYALVLATVSALLLLSLPSLLVTLLVSALFLRVPLAPHPLILLVIPLCASSLAGIGALIGVSVRRPEEGGSISLVTTMILTGLGPVIIPPERLPAIMNTLGRLSPATYAASALRQALLGPLSPQLWLDLAALLAFTVATLWLVGRKMDWRQK
jgi:ABC-2 type transport system permease protein